MDEKRLAVAAVIWSVSVLFATYLYRLAITDTIYVQNVTITKPTHTQPLTQND